MPASDRLVVSLTRRPLLILLLAFFGLLWIAGGSSFGDVLGQVLVRAGAWACLVGMILFGTKRPFRERGRAVLLFLVAAVLLAAVQLVPLPPDLWARLPGRAAFATASAFAGDPAPWRPLATVPSAALNALGSLVVPCAVLFLVAGTAEVSDGAVIKILLGMVVAGMFIGLFQFAGASLYDPLINRGDEVAGTFSNHNHFALMMACGLLLAPAWAFYDGRRPGWRGAVVIGLIPLLVMAILASGSRAGMLVGVVALGCGSAMVWRPLRRILGRSPRWVFPALIAGLAVTLAGLVALTVAADRAVSIHRALMLDPGQDMRRRALPTVLAMTREYFPLGSGLGGFDAVFRMHEPFGLLKPTYFNRAHNDFLEIVLDTGVFGLMLLIAALAWWAWMSVRAWRPGPGSQAMLPRLGSALLLIVGLASIVDYPARTPMMMAVVVVAAVWLSMAASPRGSPLPSNGQAL